MIEKAKSRSNADAYCGFFNALYRKNYLFLANYPYVSAPLGVLFYTFLKATAVRDGR